MTERADWAEAFAGRTGCLVLAEGRDGPLSGWNADRAATAFLPASTYKIPHSLIALETGVVRDLEQVFPWDGVERFSPPWNQDHTLASALQFSVVPIYQGFAREIGEERMRRWVDRLEYGNRDISGGIDHFWLDGALRISALAQIEFLRRLEAESLPISERSQRLVKQILLAEEGDGYRLFAKTGTTIRVDQPVAWWVGWVEREDARWFFSCNLEVATLAEAQVRQTIVKKILRQEGILSGTSAE